jgi:hypothetical protein
VRWFIGDIGLAFQVQREGLGPGLVDGCAGGGHAEELEVGPAVEFIRQRVSFGGVEGDRDFDQGVVLIAQRQEGRAVNGDLKPITVVVSSDEGVVKPPPA